MSDNRIAWRRASKGIFFIGIGVFLFLSTQGYLHRGFWLDTLVFWPMCLVALGIRLIFERTRAPWAILLSPLLIMATLSYVAWRGPEYYPGGWETLRAERVEGVTDWTLEARTGLVHLDVTARPLGEGVLVQGRTSPPDRNGLRVSRQGDSARVSLQGGRRNFGFISTLPRRRHRWDLEVAQGLPMKLVLEAAFAQGEIDLEAVPLRRMDLDGAFNDVTVRLGQPDEEVRLDFEGAFNHVKLVVPDDTPVRVFRDGFLNLVDRRSDRSRTGVGYRVRIDGAFNRVVVRSE